MEDEKIQEKNVEKISIEDVKKEEETRKADELVDKIMQKILQIK